MACPVPASVLRPGSLAYDMMYGPAAQGFLDWAQAHGAVARDGLGMLVEQAAEAFAIWRGVRPPSAQVLEELAAPALSHARTPVTPWTPWSPAMKAAAALAGPGGDGLVACSCSLCCALPPWRPSTPNPPPSSAPKPGRCWTKGPACPGASRVPYGHFRPPQARGDRIGRRWLCEPRRRGLGRDQKRPGSATPGRSPGRQGPSRAPTAPVRAPRSGGSTHHPATGQNLLLSGERTLLRKGQEFVLTLRWNRS